MEEENISDFFAVEADFRDRIRVLGLENKKKIEDLVEIRRKIENFEEEELKSKQRMEVMENQYRETNLNIVDLEAKVFVLNNLLNAEKSKQATLNKSIVAKKTEYNKLSTTFQNETIKLLNPQKPAAVNNHPNIATIAKPKTIQHRPQHIIKPLPKPTTLKPAIIKKEPQITIPLLPPASNKVENTPHVKLIKENDLNSKSVHKNKEKEVVVAKKPDVIVRTHNSINRAMGKSQEYIRKRKPETEEYKPVKKEANSRNTSKFSAKKVTKPSMVRKLKSKHRHSNSNAVNCKKKPKPSSIACEEFDQIFPGLDIKSILSIFFTNSAEFMKRNDPEIQWWS